MLLDDSDYLLGRNRFFGGAHETVLRAQNPARCDVSIVNANDVLDTSCKADGLTDLRSHLVEPVEGSAATLTVLKQVEASVRRLYFARVGESEKERKAKHHCTTAEQHLEPPFP